MTYLSTILADNPVHYWRLADPGGSVAHDIGSNPIHLGLGPVNAGSLSYSGIAANGGAAWIDSGFGWANINANTIPKPITVEAWVWLLINPLALMWVFDWGGFDTAGIDLVINTAGKVNADWVGTNAQSAAALTRQTWHHIAATVDASNLRLYVDGALAHTSATAAAPTTDQICIGKNAGAGAFSAGAIAEVATYSAALSGTQIAAHYAAQEINGPPIFNRSGTGDLFGSGASTGDGLLQQILKSVRKVY